MLHALLTPSVLGGGLVPVLVLMSMRRFVVYVRGRASFIVHR